MYTDIVFPKNNEKEFIALAEKLGYKALCLVYDLKSFDRREFDTKLKIFYGVVCSEKELGKTKNIADVTMARSSDANRHIIEKGKANVMFDLETEGRKDSTHYRRSGLNHVMCNLLKKKDVTLGVSLRTLLASKKMLRIQMIGRIMQNIKLARKYKFHTVFASFADKPLMMRAPHDMVAVLISFGMHPTEAKDALRYGAELIEKNIKKKSPAYICEGVELVD